MKFFTTLRIVLIMLLSIYGLTVLLWSCSIVKREGSTSPCYANKHMVGYGPGGWGKGRMKQ